MGWFAFKMYVDIRNALILLRNFDEVSMCIFKYVMKFHSYVFIAASWEFLINWQAFRFDRKRANLGYLVWKKWRKSVTHLLILFESCLDLYSMRKAQTNSHMSFMLVDQIGCPYELVSLLWMWLALLKNSNYLECNGNLKHIFFCWKAQSMCSIFFIFIE